jgi:diguanylate cyclase (GGDEF)-like protein
LTRVLRGSDHAFRIGGDEFAVILPKATAADARAVAVRIAQELRTLASAEDWEPSMSLGIAVLNDTHDPAALLRAADDAMYEMKRKRDALEIVEHAPSVDDGLDAVA